MHAVREGVVLLECRLMLLESLLDCVVLLLGLVDVLREGVNHLLLCLFVCIASLCLF